MSVKIIKKTLRVFAIALLVLLLLPLIVSGLLLINPVQNWVVDLATDAASESIGSEVSIGTIYLKPFTEIDINEVLVRDHRNDTLLYAGEISASLLSLSFDSSYVDLGKVSLSEGYFNMATYQSDTMTNLAVFLSNFPKSEDTTSSVFTIRANDVEISDSRFRFIDWNADTKPSAQIDFKHLEMDNISGVFSDIIVVGDSVHATIEDLRTIERSGFQLRQFDAAISVSSNGVITESLLLETNRGVVNGFFAMKTEEWSDYSDFLQKVHLDANLVESRIVFDDLAYFTPELKHLLTPLHFTGKVSGPIANLSATIDSLGFLNSGALKGKIKVKGLPEIKRTFLDADIEQLYTTLEDAIQINLPTSDTLINLSFPEHIMQLDFVRYKGRFTGFVNDFVAFGDINTALGSAKADVNIKTNDGFEYSGKVSTDYFELGELIQVPQVIGNVALNLNVNGSGVEPKNMKVYAVGNVSSLDVLDYTYKNLKLDGELSSMVFNGGVSVRDTNIKLGFQGSVDFNKSIPVITARCEVEHLALAPLNLVPEDTHGVFAGNIDVKLMGSSLDMMHGSLLLEGPRYTNDEYLLSLDSLFLSDNIVDGGHDIILNSDVIDIHVEGNTSLPELPNAVRKVGHHYMPHYVSEPSLEKVDTNQKFTYSIHIKNEQNWLDLLVPKLKASDIKLSGSMDMARNEVKLSSDTLNASIDGTSVDGFTIDVWSENHHLYSNMNIDVFSIRDGLELDHLVLNSDVYKDSVTTDIHWHNDNEIADSGGVNFMVYRTQEEAWVGLLNTLQVRLASVNWNSVKQARFEKDSSSLSIRNLDLVSSTGRIKCDGAIEQNASTRLELLVRSFDLDYLKNFGFSEKAINGLVQSEIDLSYDNEALVLDGNIRVDSLKYDGMSLGNVNGLANYSSELKRVEIDVDLKYQGKENFSILGEFYPQKQKEQLDLEVGFVDFQLKAVEPFVSEFVSEFSGFANGSISVTGSLNQPNVRGGINLKEIGTHVTYLNTKYTIPHGFVQIEPDMIAMDHAMIKDVKGDSAYATAQVFHNNFKDISYDVFVQAYNFQGLNTTLVENDQYYGVANVTGDINIGGYAGHTIIDVDASTDPNTSLSIPLTSGGEVSEFDYIRFVDSNRFNVEYKDDALSEELNGLEMNFKLAVDNDAQVQIIFDEKVGDIIKVRGNGDMLMAIDNRGKFNMYGDYIIEKGDYLFTLQNIVNKRFTVKPGSRLTWNGDPLGAQLDLTAIYSLKASPAVMVQAMAGGQGASDAIYEQRLPTDVSLFMTGALTSPKIEFGVKLPSLPDGDIANQLLDPALASKDQRTSQAFSLLLANQFSAGNGAVALGGAGQSSGYEVLSNQLSNWLSQYSDNFDIGVSYRDGYVDDSGQERAGQTEVSVSRELFNNRVKVEVNGTVQGTTENQEEQSNNVAGEFNVEYKINKDGSLRARVFNESNQQSAANLNQAPYTQGVGLFYRKEFDTWGQFFRGLFGGNKEKK